MSQPLQHQARKRFGQNFLVDEGVVRQIVSAIRIHADQHIIEIGPGKGALTSQLVDHCQRLDIIELDRDLIPFLHMQFQRHAHVHIHEADALKFDFSNIINSNSQAHVVGNLPYNISTPLIFHLLSYKQAFASMHFMLQKEVVERLAAACGQKAYGRLSVMAQYFCEVDNLFEVAPHSFSPAPKVTSAIVRLLPRQAPLITADNENHFADIVRIAFQQRRKTLRNALKDILADIDHNVLNIDLSLRAERLSVSDFVTLSNQILQLTPQAQ